MKTVKLTLSILAFVLTGAFSAQGQLKQYEQPQKMSEAVNSSASEESLPLLSADGKVMYFVRSFHPDNVGGADAGHDIWYSTRNEDGSWSPASNDLGQLNNKVNNAVAGVSKDGKTIYLVNTYEGKNRTGIGLSKATKKENGEWTVPEDLQVPGINPVNDFYSFYINPEEDVLLISMQDKYSKGQNDLYLSTRDAQGSWNVPVNLGDRINTAGNEISPFLSHDRKRLFFSTDSRGGMGGQDIFVTERQDESWTNWSIPVNLPNGINSGDFDAYFSIYEGGDVYFCSSRNDTIANIYYAVESDPEEKDDEEDEDEEIVEQIKEVDPDVDSTIVVVDVDGKDDIDPAGQKRRNEGMNIYFNFDRFSLREKSKTVLSKVADELKADPKLNVRLVGHCDSIGSHTYNDNLSNQRSNEAKQFIVARGINGNRIDTAGKGKRQPAASNATPEGRQLNRRVEIYFE